MVRAQREQKADGQEPPRAGLSWVTTAFHSFSLNFFALIHSHQRETSYELEVSVPTGVLDAHTPIIHPDLIHGLLGPETETEIKDPESFTETPTCHP